MYGIKDRMLLTGVRLYEETSTARLVSTRWCVLLQKGSLHQENIGNVRSRFPHSG